MVTLDNISHIVQIYRNDDNVYKIILIMVINGDEWNYPLVSSNVVCWKIPERNRSLSGNIIEINGGFASHV
jgi:hypothetical protein